MPYECVYRNEDGYLRLPFADLPRLLYLRHVQISPQERPALENMLQFLSSVMILASRLRAHLFQYEQDTWVNVPFAELFVDTQTVVLFLRQFMEDIAVIIRVVLPPVVRHQMPASFTDLAARIRASGPARDARLAAVLPAADPFREFLVAEEQWLQEVKDLRDDICHRTTYGRLRTATFPPLMELIRAGGGVAPFASEADLRSYLRALFQRWLALACLVGDFVSQRIRVEHPVRNVPVAPGFIVREGEIVPTPLGTGIMTVPGIWLDGLEYFVGEPPL
jgi:hypothetical protein